jgi:O-antigen/teichoic acid export membrane protein
MSILKNYSYNLVYQVTLILIPVISIPYISRVIGSQGIGIYAYTNSVAQYFILFANLGLTLYASREIAYVKENKFNLSKVFSEIVVLQFTGTIFVLALYYVYVLLFCENYKLIYIIQSVSIISVAFDISWLYIGMENFKKNVIRNLVVKISAFILLFLVVKRPEDLWKYVALSVGSILLGQIYMWLGIGKFINKISFKNLQLIKHLRKALNFFLIVSIGVIGVNLNKTLIGLFVNKSELGKYEMAYRIITMSLIIVTSLGSVMTPRISATYGEGNKSKVNEYLKMSLQFILFFCFLIIPLTIGVSVNFVSWFLGSKFAGAELYLVIMAPMILLNSLSNLLANQYMIPSGNEKKYVFSLIVGGSIGILSSFILVSRFSTIGACIAVLIGEISVLMAHIIQTKGQKELLNILGNWWQFLLASLPILLISFFLKFFIKQPILLTFSQVLVSTVIYTLMLLLFKNDFVGMIYVRLKSMLFADLER